MLSAVNAHARDMPGTFMQHATPTRNSSPNPQPEMTVKKIIENVGRMIRQRDNILSIHRNTGDAVEKSTFSSLTGARDESASLRGRGGKYLLTG